MVVEYFVQILLAVNLKLKGASHQQVRSGSIPDTVGLVGFCTIHQHDQHPLRELAEEGGIPNVAAHFTARVGPWVIRSDLLKCSER
jgi:hypothetical protein